MILRRPLFSLFLCMLSGFFNPVHRALAEDVHVQVVSSVTATGGQSAVLLGLKFTLPAGWKIYTPESDKKSPIKRHPILDYSLSENISSVHIRWPQADIIKEESEEIPVYTQDVILPMWVEIENPNLAMTLKGTLSFIACHKQCVPYDIPVSFILPAGPGKTSEYANNIQAYDLNEPLKELLEFEETPFWSMLIMAFLGGLILNFMPCVLPVLSLKLRSLVKQSHIGARVSYKAHFAATFLGIMASFLLYALVAISLQAGGKSLGWGMHFQEPLFLVGMALLMVLFAANLWGAFDIHLTASIQTKMNDLINHQRAKVRLYAEGFLSGVFATLLATPCTAPFLGTTLAYALSHSPVHILVLFLTLGMGFATPYWVTLLVPPQWMLVPKPGKWLDWVSRVLGVGLVLTTVWLIWLLYESQGIMPAFLVSVVLVFLSLALFLREKYSFMRLCVVPLCVGVMSIPLVIEEKKSHTLDYEDSLWHLFEPEKIPDLVKSGKIVFVDITAAWCVTCQVNKSRVLRDSHLAALLASKNVYCMRGHWTNRDENIRTYLARYQRYGIPFNQVFGSDALEGILLPEFLKIESVMQAFSQAGFSDSEEG